MSLVLHATPIAGVFEVESIVRHDERGSFSRLFCAGTFAAVRPGLRFVQTNHSITGRAGTVRGLHYQRAPFADAKLVRCIAGAVFDVAIDVRPSSPTFGRWHAVELTAANGRCLFIPEGCAHGFQALTDDAGLLYQHTVPFAPAYDAGLDHADPDIGIVWPLPVTLLSSRDRSLPSLASVHLDAGTDVLGFPLQAA